MQKLTLWIGILAFVAPFAAHAQVPTTPPSLLSASQQSGFVRPQYRFAVQCEISAAGKLHSEILSDSSTGQWANRELIDRDLSPAELDLLQHLIIESREGPFDHGQNPCDIGSQFITAHVGGIDLAIVASEDCGPRVTNLNLSAKKLADWAKKECKLR